MLLLVLIKVEYFKRDSGIHAMLLLVLIKAD